MARTELHFVKKARKPIYTEGKATKNKRGFTVIDRTIPANKKDKILVEVGQSYYWWKWRFGSKNVSLTEPTPDQLTRYGKSEWDEKMEDYEERKGNLDSESDKDDLLEDISEFKEELESRLENIPESLKESSVLNERIEELDTLYDEVTGIEIEEED